MPPFVLYTTPTFSRGTIAQVILEECQAPYTTELINLHELPTNQGYKDINPMAKVPALVHGDAVITELAAIVLYLADAYYDTGIAPAPNTAERGQMYRYLFLLVNFEYAVFAKIRQVSASEDERIGNGYGDFASIHQTLCRLFAGKQYALGDHYTLMDTYAAMFFMWATKMGALSDDDPLVAYAKAHMGRPAFGKVMAGLEGGS